MNPVTRAATEAEALAFALAALAVAMLYTTLGGVHGGSVLAPAIALGGVGGVTAFLSVLALATGRFQDKKPVLGARRGAVIGILAVVVVASAHSLFTFGSGDLLYNLVGQVG